MAVNKKPSEIVEEMCKELGGRLTRTRDGNVECKVLIRRADLAPEGAIDEELGSFKIVLLDHYRGIFEGAMTKEELKNKDKYNYFTIFDVEGIRPVHPIPKDVHIEFDFGHLGGALHETNVFLSGNNVQVTADIFVYRDEPREITIRSEDSFNSIRIWLD